MSPSRSTTGFTNDALNEEAGLVGTPAIQGTRGKSLINTMVTQWISLWYNMARPHADMGQDVPEGTNGDAEEATARNTGRKTCATIVENPDTGLENAERKPKDCIW
jgi:hypothetical protein